MSDNQCDPCYTNAAGKSSSAIQQHHKVNTSQLTLFRLPDYRCVIQYVLHAQYMHFKHHVIQFKHKRVNWRAVWRFTPQPWKFKISLCKHANVFFVSSYISSRLWWLSRCIFSTTERKHRSQRHRSCSPWRLHQYRIRSFWHLYFRTFVIIHQITFAAAAETWNGVFKVRGKAALTLWELNLLYSELSRRRQVWMYSVDFWQLSVWKGLCFAFKNIAR